MINPFEIIKTDWVIGPQISTALRLKSRVVAPLWMAWILVKLFKHDPNRELGKIFGYLFSKLAQWNGAYIEQNYSVVKDKQGIEIR